MEKEPSLVMCAHSIIDTVPRLSRLMRKDLRLHSAGLFTEPQFRVMARLFREGAQTISDLAGFMGVSLPTMSRLIQGLGSRGLVVGERDSEDHRCVFLVLTEQGIRDYASVLQRTENHMVDWIGDLTAEQRVQIIESFALLDEMFAKVELPASYGDAAAADEDV
jgi:DNA-binding MarR family transcriptional regulator